MARRKIPAVPVNVTTNKRYLKFADKSEYLSGSISFYAGQLLHLLLDLEYQPPQIITSNEQSASPAIPIEPVRYQLVENRRVKFKELHYFDHPKFGVLATVYPVKP